MIDFSRFAPGAVFARRYRIVRLLKAGGMGAVYEATHEQTRRRVALKLMRPEIVSDATERQRFVQEAQVATMIESSFVVDVLDAGVDEESGVPYLVMEFLVGEELGDLIKRRGRLPPHEVVALLHQAARALDKAHARGVIHRDLKPENMFLAIRDDAPPSLKILDFGIAKVLQNAAATSTRGTGTPLYMAPEQTRRSSQIGAPTDVWALGLVTYTLLLGRPYWLAEDVHQLIGEIIIEPLEPASRRAAMLGIALPPAFDAWFFGCVDRDPSRRYPSAGHAVAALAAVFGVQLPAAGSMPISQMLAAPSALERTEPDTARKPDVAMAATTAAPQTDDVRARSGGSGTRRPATPMVIGAAALVALIALGVGVRALLKSDDRASIATTGSTEAAPTDSAASTASTPPKPATLADELAALNPFITVGRLGVHQHEVTREEFGRYVMSFAEDKRDPVRPLEGWRGEPIVAATRHRPVTWVTYEHAADYCKAIDARLPTSAEWGTALRRTYPWGDDWPANLDGVAIARGENAQPIDVGTSGDDRTSDGVVDLAGNVEEWTSTVSGSSAVVRGASISMIESDAKEAITTENFTKFTGEGAPPGSPDNMMAGARHGFRCVRDKKR